MVYWYLLPKADEDVKTEETDSAVGATRDYLKKNRDTKYLAMFILPFIILFCCFLGLRKAVKKLQKDNW